MHDVIAAAVIDAIMALRDASKGVPNVLLRDLNSIHSNTAFQDLPPALQKSVEAHVRSAFSRLQKEGYTVLNPRLAPPPRPQPTAPPHSPRPAAGAGAARRPRGKPAKGPAR